MLQFEGYTLDIARNSLRTADRKVALRRKSFELLRYLAENPDRVVTKEELLKAVWPDVVVTEESLTHCVSEGRQAIGDSKQTIIETVPRRGYRFAAAVSRIVTNAGAPPSATAEVTGAPSGSDAGQGLDRPPSRCCRSPSLAATRSRTISATALPRTLRPRCRGSPSS